MNERANKSILGGRLLLRTLQTPSTFLASLQSIDSPAVKEEKMAGGARRAGWRVGARVDSGESGLRWESWRSGTFEHSSSARGFYPTKHPPFPPFFIYSWVGALNHPTPSFILTRSMAFTYRGRRGEIKMAIRYPGILNTTSLAVHCAAVVTEALMGRKSTGLPSSPARTSHILELRL